MIGTSCEMDYLLIHCSLRTFFYFICVLYLFSTRFFRWLFSWLFINYNIAIRIKISIKYCHKGMDYDQIERYLKNGREGYNEYCCEETTESTQITSTNLHRSVLQLPGSRTQLQGGHQSDYETEDQVYRALERLRLLLIVIHNFQYTHHHYRLCDKGHIRWECSKCSNTGNKEDEFDFLIVGAGFFSDYRSKEYFGNVMECEPDFRF